MKDKRRPLRAGLVAGGISILAGAALAGSEPVKFPTLPKGYLAPGSLNAAQIVPPAPTDGDARDQVDRKVFQSTRALKDSDRWKLATRDVDMMPAGMMQAYSCAVGVQLTPANAPKLNGVMMRVLGDSMIANESAKHHFKRLRPFQVAQGEICQPTAQVAGSYDYPSGHTVWGWSWALVLAELAPDRATEILARGRAYGQSRAVCGAHNASAVEAGGMVAAATNATLHGSAEFRADMDAARAELAKLRLEGEKPPACEAEAALVAQSPY